jgi:hypothetical protein
MSYVSGRLFAGQVTGIGSGSATQLDSSQNCREVLVQSDPGNSPNVLVGNSAHQYVVLTPGQSVTIPVISLTLVYVKAVSGTVTVNWLARD